MIKSLTLTAAAALTLIGSAAFADGHGHGGGDAEAGENLWRNCRSCHMITADDGTVIQNGGRTGPNLYGLPGRAVASVEDFRYGPAILAFAELDGGQVWTEEVFVEYVTNPTTFLREHLGDQSARSAMTFRLNRGAEDMWAYLVSVSPAVAADDADTEEAAPSE